MKQIGEGAEAKIYEAEIFGNDVIVKGREKKDYRIKEIDESLRHYRTKKEAKILHKLSEAKINVPKILAVGKFSIYMEKIEGILLKDTKITKFEIIKAAQILARIHDNGVIHGDFTPANILVDKNKIYIIDFGLAEITNNYEERALDLLLMKRSLSSREYEIFEEEYKKYGQNAVQIIKRLAEIEKRGRYQTRTLL